MITLLAVFLAGIVVEHAWREVRKLDRDKELRRVREEADFWREQDGAGPVRRKGRR